MVIIIIVIKRVRVTARGTNLADLIQPSLAQLQPNLEEIMDTLEPLQGNYFLTYMNVFLTSTCRGILKISNVIYKCESLCFFFLF